MKNIKREDAQKIEEKIKYYKMRAHLNETSEKRIVRLANEYCIKRRIYDGCDIENGIRELEKIHYRKPQKKKWEMRDKKSEKWEKKELCFLYQNGYAKLVEGEIKYRKTEKYNEEETDKTEEKMTIYIPLYKLKFEIAKIRDFDLLAEEIEVGNNKYKRNEFLGAILKTRKNVYEIR